MGKFIESLSLIMTYDLSCLSAWLIANKIALNAAKTEVIVFRSRLICKVNILFNGHKLNPSVLALNIWGVFSMNLQTEQVYLRSLR